MCVHVCVERERERERERGRERKIEVYDLTENRKCVYLWMVVLRDNQKLVFLVYVWGYVLGFVCVFVCVYVRVCLWVCMCVCICVRILFPSKILNNPY